MELSKDAVIWCYRAILGREPESEKVVQIKLNQHFSFESLRESFFRSEEFSKKRNFLQANPRQPGWTGVLGHPPIDVDYEATPWEVEKCLEHIKNAWTHLGEVTPHHSVLTADAFMPDNLEKNVDAFWTSGSNEVATIQAMLKRHFFDSRGKTCVEFGCGVGRVSMPLSQELEKLHAFDISVRHLAIARERAGELVD